MSSSIRLTMRLFSLLAAACTGISTGVTPTIETGTVENPQQGVPVRIAHIEDARGFQRTAAARMVPSLRGEDEDPSLRERAIGRDALPNGRPGANVFLEPPHTVESVARDATETATR